MAEEQDVKPPESVLLAKPRLPVHLVDTNEALAELVLVLKTNSQPIAIDAERASGFRYGQRAYLVQIAIQNSKIYLIDPVPGYEKSLWDEFLALIGSTTWIIHAASQDLPCLTELGIKPSGILDTELAARLIGIPRVALGTLTEHYLKIKLAKEHSAVDWSERPLPEEWLNYAALDVDVLFDLWESIELDLKDKGKEEIARQEFEFLLEPIQKAPKVDRWRSMTGLHEVKDQRALTVAMHLWNAREALAKEKDVAPGRLIPDSSIVAAVKEKPKSRSELAGLKSFSGRASRTFIDNWWRAIEEGSNTKNLVELRPKAIGLPNHRNWPQKFPLAHARLVASKELLANLSKEHQIPQENILNPETLRIICFEPPTPLTKDSLQQALLARNVRPWQQEMVSEGLLISLTKETVEQKDKELDSPA